VVEGVGLGCVVELVEDGGDLFVGGRGSGDEGQGVFGLVEDAEGWGGGVGAGGVVGLRGSGRGGCGLGFGRGVAAERK